MKREKGRRNADAEEEEEKKKELGKKRKRRKGGKWCTRYDFESNSRNRRAFNKYIISCKPGCPIIRHTTHIAQRND